VSSADQMEDLGAGVPGSTDRTGLRSDEEATVGARRGHLRTAPALEPVEHVEPEYPTPVRRDAAFRRLLALADLGAAAIALIVIDRLTGRGFGVMGILCTPVIVLLAKLMGRYDHDDVMLRRSTIDEVPQLFALAAVWALTWSLVGLFTGDHVSLGGGGVAVLWLTAAVLLVGTRAVARGLAKQFTHRERVLIVGSAHARERLAASLKTDPSARIEIVGFLPLEDERRAAAPGDWGSRSRRKRRRTFDDLARVVDEMDVDRVFLIPTSADSETMLEAVTRTTALGVNVSIVPRLFEVVGSAVEFDSIGGVTVLGVRRPGLSRSSRLVKRWMDVSGAAIGLLLLSPVFAVIAVAIKLDSRGPVFFRQARVGRDGRHFRMLKFRSMVDGAEAQRAALQALNETDGLFKIKDDPRITRVGHWVRRTSIDELPQLINVLVGSMSLVGPRPLVIDEDRLIEGRHRDRLQLAPGMTGPWQVLGPTRPPLSEMVKTDYLYAANWSVWTDVKIVARTFAHVAAQRGV
jgi:exopolysaccharide biosynthesis polyprenyl glycosylphosphotransferase